MDLYLQFGYGMMEHSRELFARWNGGVAILSPRDLEPEQIVRISSDLIGLNGNILIDPQFYLPRADHHRLTSYAYWPKNYDTQGFSDSNREDMLNELVKLNLEANATALIVPGERADIVDDLWLDSQAALLEAARKVSDFPLYVTICLSSDAVRSNEQINLVVEQEAKESVKGYYLVLEHPNNDYLVDDPQWLSNCLDLATGLKKLGSEVIVGYSNQQQLIMACAGVSAIASGTWMNVRSFFPEKFRSQYEEEIKRRTVWYYCSQSFSEFTLPYLDIGVRLGFKDKLVSDIETEYGSILFETPQPSLSGWSESYAFRHYLLALQEQANSLTQQSYTETINLYSKYLDSAEQYADAFRSNGIVGQTRDFGNVIDATKASLNVLNSIHGPILQRRWNEFISA